MMVAVVIVVAPVVLVVVVIVATIVWVAAVAGYVGVAAVAGVTTKVRVAGPDILRMFQPSLKLTYFFIPSCPTLLPSLGCADSQMYNKHSGCKIGLG
jgi:hypothetical protein